MTMVHHWFSRFVVLVFLSFALALSALPTRATETAPDVLVQTAVDEIILAMNADNGSAAGKRARTRVYIENNISPLIDYERMIKSAMGISWRTATTDERAELTLQFRKLLVNLLSGLIIEHQDKVIDFYAHIGATDTVAAVRVKIKDGSQEVASMTIFMEKSGNSWKAYNVEIGQASIIAMYQNQFRDEVRRGGIPGLINALKKQNVRAEKITSMNSPRTTEIVLGLIYSYLVNLPK